MAEYILQEATLALPDVFKDRTMNLFTMSDNGASEFTFVVSCATAKNEDKVHDAATRLTRELEITVPDFRLESSQMTSVNGHPAVELFYQFKNDNSVIFQKQTVILLADHPGGQKMELMFFPAGKLTSFQNSMQQRLKCYLSLIHRLRLSAGQMNLG